MGNNRLTEVDLTKNINLEKIDISQNNLTKIDLSQNRNLKVIVLEYNKLENVIFYCSLMLSIVRLREQDSKICEIQIRYREENYNYCLKMKTDL
jgi:Leucine-rich repeat (LRR) protein